MFFAVVHPYVVSVFSIADRNQVFTGIMSGTDITLRKSLSSVLEKAQKSHFMEMNYFILCLVKYYTLTRSAVDTSYWV
jgi:hypothetical protein